MAIKIRAGRIYAVIQFADKEKAKLINGFRWHPQIKNWSWPLTAKMRVCAMFPELADEIDKETERYREGIRHMQEVKEKQFNNLEIDKALFKRKPLDHQIVMVKNMLLENQHGILSGVGTGKTQAIINTFDYLYRQGQVKKCLIITKMTILDNWTDEIKINSDYRYIILHGTKQKRLKMIATEQQFYIINYAGLLVLKNYDFWDKFDMVVLDESSLIKDHTRKRTNLILEKFKNTKFKYICSGSSITQSPLDIWTQFYFLNPAYFNQMNYYEFKNHYCIKGGYENKEVIGYKNLEELKRIVALHSTQFSIEDCYDLPEKLYTQHRMELSLQLRRQYKEMMEDFLMYSEKGLLTADIIITKMLRMKQILSGAYLKERKNNLKLLELEGIIKDNIHERQIIIWCEYIPSFELIKEMVSRLGIPYSEMRGKTKNRKEQWDKFNSGKTKIFIGQMKTGDMGINLTAASIVVYFENTFSLETRIQTEGRAHRIGQKNKVLYIDLIYKGTIEEDIMKAIKTKQDIAKYLVKSFKPGIYDEGAVA